MFHLTAQLALPHPQFSSPVSDLVRGGLVQVNKGSNHVLDVGKGT